MGIGTSDAAGAAAALRRPSRRPPDVRVPHVEVRRSRPKGRAGGDGERPADGSAAEAPGSGVRRSGRAACKGVAFLGWRPKTFARG